MKSPSLELLNLFKGGLALRKVAAPTLSRPISQACTQAQTEGPIIDEWYKKARLQTAMHRKLWEFLHILQSLSLYDQIKVEMRAKGHRKLQFAEWSTTSFGLVVQKTTSG